MKRTKGRHTGGRGASPSAGGRSRTLPALLVSGLLWAGAVWAAGVPGAAAWKTGSEPLQVDAKTMTHNAKENVIVFDGEVVAHQGPMTLHADRVEVRVDPKSQEIRTVHATGNVRLLKEDLVAVGEAADYEAAAGVAVLTGNPKVWRGKDVVAGEKITVFLSDNRSTVEGRVKAVLFPPAKKEAGDAP